MNNREKVIKGVNDARRYLEDREWIDKSVGVHIDALNDAIALLNEQEHMFHALEDDWKRLKELLKEQETVEHAKEILCANGWEKMRFPEGTIGKWDDPEIVRCKGCKHYEYGYGCKLWHTINNQSDDWFCADGVGKDDGG